MTRNKMIGRTLKNLEQKREEILASYRNARAAAANAEGPMQSRYDTVKKERSWLADSLAKRIRGIEETIMLLKAAGQEIAPITNGVEMVLVQFDKEENASLCILLPEGAAVELDEENIIPISIASPLGKAIVDTDPGEIVEVKTPGGIRMIEVLKREMEDL